MMGPDGDGHNGIDRKHKVKGAHARMRRNVDNDVNWRGNSESKIVSQQNTFKEASTQERRQDSQAICVYARILAAEQEGTDIALLTTTAMVTSFDRTRDESSVPLE